MVVVGSLALAVRTQQQKMVEKDMVEVRPAGSGCTCCHTLPVVKLVMLSVDWSDIQGSYACQHTPLAVLEPPVAVVALVVWTSIRLAVVAARLAQVSDS